MMHYENFDLSIQETINHSNNQLVEPEIKTERNISLRPLQFGDLDIIFFTHKRWNFIFQRSQYFLQQFALKQRIFYIEEPISGNSETAFLVENQYIKGIKVITPYLPSDLSLIEKNMLLNKLLHELFMRHSVNNNVLWYQAANALEFSEHLLSDMVVYDSNTIQKETESVEEMSVLEEKLMKKADTVFTFNDEFYDSKVGKHSNMHAFPPDQSLWNNTWLEMKGILENTFAEKNVLSLCITEKE